MQEIKKVYISTIKQTVIQKQIIMKITDCTVNFDHTHGAGTMTSESEQSDAAQICESAIENAEPSSIEEAIEIAENALQNSEFAWMRESHSVIVYPE